MRVAGLEEQRVKRVKIASCHPDSAAQVLVAFCSFFHDCGLSPRTLEDVFSPGYFVRVGFCSILLRV